MNYYTYAYLREDKTPYYIGKGKGRRALEKHFSGSANITPPKERILYLKKNLTEEEAFRHEIYMISVLGRKDLGTGILRNRSNGGIGGDTGYLGSKEHIELMKSKTGEKNNFYGKIHTEESKAKISKSLKGRKAHNKGKYQKNVSSHALYMREYRKKKNAGTV